MPPRALLPGLLLLGTLQQSAPEQGAPTQEQTPQHDPLAELVAAQREDGRWAVEDLDSTPPHEPPCPCAAPERALGDVGLTSLVLLALLEQDSTPRRGAHAQSASQAQSWLRHVQQDEETGLIGARAADGWLYDHALATVVLGELARADRNPVVRRSFRQALQALERARIPGSAWGARTETAGGGEDVYVTALAVSALEQVVSGAAGNDFEVDAGYRADVLAWLDSVTDAKTGELVGSRRTPQRAATAAALWTRVQLGRTADDDALLSLGLQALLERSVTPPDALGCELEGTLFGSLAAYCAGDSKAWSRWSSQMKTRLSGKLRTPPADARALVVTALCASVYFRYVRVLVR